MKNAVLITADSLRYDLLSADGDPETTPFLDKLAEDGVFFENAVPTGPGTSSSFPGILASALPLEHGYRGLNSAHQPVAEQLQQSGVRTLGLSSSTHVSSLYGYNRGFHKFDEPSIEGTEENSGRDVKKAVFDFADSIPVVRNIGRQLIRYIRSFKRDIQGVERPYELAEDITNRAVEMIRTDIEAYPDQPRFVWVGYMEPHSPPYPPEKYVKIFHDGEFNRTEIHELWKRWSRQRPPLWDETAETDAMSILTTNEVAALRDYYRAQARYLDDELKRFVESLEQLGIRDETAVLFTTDHGEEFFEHGDLGHRQKLYDELVHVPLIASAGGEAWNAQDYTGTISLLDLAPTIADLLDVEPAAEWQGQSFTSVLQGGTHERKYAISELSHRGSDGYGGDVRLEDVVMSVRTADWKYIRNKQKGSEELYDLSTDMAEEQNVLEAYPSTSSKLSTIVEDRIKSLSDRRVVNVDISADVREQLQELGYTGE